MQSQHAHNHIQYRSYTSKWSKNEVERLVLLGVLDVVNDSEWVALYFVQHKPKSNWVRFLSDFRNLNKHLNQKPYPMPKINEMLFKLDGFQHDTSIDLSMGYYHIQLSKNTNSSCTSILLWGKFCYKRLPMGVAYYPYMFQQYMDYLFHGIEFICAYIDELLILTKGYWTYHV